MWYLVAAVPLGMVCGVLGACFLLLNGIFRKMRAKIMLKFKRAGYSDAFGLLCVSTCTGLVYGGIALVCPLTLGSGAMILPDVIKAGTQTVASQRGGGEETANLVPIISRHTFLFSGIMKIVSSSLCLGVGLMGGQLFPLIFTGACVGIAIPCYVPFLPLEVTLPCCMASITGSFVPIPLTLSVFAMMKCGHAIDMGATVLVSVTVAYSLNAGLGLIQKGKERMGIGEEEKEEAMRQPLLDFSDIDQQVEVIPLNEI